MSVLFLVACSLTKEQGGTAGFDRGATIAAAVPRHADALASRRREVHGLVTSSEGEDWQGVALKDLAYNRGLARGVDLGGRKSARYLPALDRYQGRFFQALGDAEPARRRAKGNTLIVSGLYGLLRASEPIQLYSCPLSPEVAEVWRRDGLLTDILRAYIERNGILRVVDLTAMEAYRRLIHWDRVAAGGIDVLHCFDTMAAGESALTSFGRFFRYLLSLDDDDLVGLEPHNPPTAFGTCQFHRSIEPPPDYPRETWHPDMAAEVLRGGVPDDRTWSFSVTARFQSDARRAIEAAVSAVIEICRAPMTPRDNKIRRLEGHQGRLWRYRLGDLRLVYEPDPAERVVLLRRFGPRGDVYKGL